MKIPLIFDISNLHNKKERKWERKEEKRNYVGTLVLWNSFGGFKVIFTSFMHTLLYCYICLIRLTYFTLYVREFLWLKAVFGWVVGWGGGGFEIHKMFYCHWLYETFGSLIAAKIECFSLIACWYTRREEYTFQCLVCEIKVGKDFLRESLFKEGVEKAMQHKNPWKGLFRRTRRAK